MSGLREPAGGPTVEPRQAFARGALPPLLRVLRPHQWVKNVLLFVPLILAQEGGDAGKLLAALAAFVAFCLASSAVYVINDIVDVESDRRHRSKRFRPFASGALHPRIGPPLVAALVAAAGVVTALWSNAAVGLLLASYVTVALLYSIRLKRELLVDVFALTALYSFRLLAGGYATDTAVSEWLLAFAGFLFTSLAFAKRYTELTFVTDEGLAPSESGRAYHPDDLGVIESVGPTSGYLAVLVLALYINSEQVATTYANPVMLWLLCPVLLYWLTRLWFFAKRGELDDDPVVFALTDRVSLLVGLAGVSLLFLAMVGWGPTLP